LKFKVENWVGAFYRICFKMSK